MTGKWQPGIFDVCGENGAAIIDGLYDCKW